MTNWWVQSWLEWYGPVFIGSWIFWVIGSIILHELGHGWAALWCGDDTPRALGHMTWNPLVHLGGTALILFALFGFTWGAMPVNPSNFRRRHDDALVAAAGPAMNLVQAAVCVLLGLAWVTASPGVDPHVDQNIRVFLYVGLVVNLTGMMFNLIPVPPLDGSRIVADFVPSYREFVNSERGQVAAFVAFAVLFLFLGRHVWGVTFSTGMEIMTGVTGTPRAAWLPIRP
ncbi:MAG: site-2 protease family protein [Phycisphaeraceae bacterium]|nr:MAG: site-2 protease family protein [Phycisphaeraceae bacterium]